MNTITILAVTWAAAYLLSSMGFEKKLVDKAVARSDGKPALDIPEGLLKLLVALLPIILQLVGCENIPDIPVPQQAPAVTPTSLISEQSATSLAQTQLPLHLVGGIQDAKADTGSIRNGTGDPSFARPVLVELKPGGLLIRSSSATSATNTDTGNPSGGTPGRDVGPISGTGTDAGQSQDVDDGQQYQVVAHGPGYCEQGRCTATGTRPVYRSMAVYRKTTARPLLRIIRWRPLRGRLFGSCCR